MGKDTTLSSIFHRHYIPSLSLSLKLFILLFFHFPPYNSCSATGKVVLHDQLPEFGRRVAHAAAARGQDQEEDLEPRHAHVPDDGALAAGAGDEE